MNKWTAFGVMCLCIGVLGMGCTATQQGAGVGAGVGGLVGGIIGHQSGHTAGGILIGAAVGALAGYVVGDIIEDRQVKNAQETNQDYGYKPAEESPRLDLRSIRIIPISVAPGGKITTTLTLAVLGPAGYETDLIETTKLQHEGTVSVLLENASLGVHKPGTYEISRAITLPNDVAPGEYAIIKNVTCAGCDISSASTSFVVTGR